MKRMGIMLVLAAFLLAPVTSSETSRGQENVTREFITFSFGAKTGRTKLLFLSNNVYLDTSATGQAGQYARIDNTADSCSVPMPIVADTSASVSIRPTWLSGLLWIKSWGVAGVNNSKTFRVQSTERVPDFATRWRFLRWTKSGMNSGHSGQDIKDVLTSVNTGLSEMISQYMGGQYMGGWVRFCPDDNVETANGAADSAFADSLFHVTQ